MPTEQTQTKHTPGPWKLWTSNSWRRFGSEQVGRCVCEPVTQRDGHPDLHFANGGEDGPDARLIAAAPELLEALEALPLESFGDDMSKCDAADFVDHAGEFFRVMQMARAAIRKAKGEL